MHTSTTKKAAMLMGLVAAAGLTGCGGGGGGGTPPPPPAPATTVAISGKAVDGPLQGAKACYDLNDNGACDTGEPSATTAADGSFSFDVITAAAGQHRVVVEVPDTAIDAETGAAVGTAFTLQSPATGTAGAQSVFASPLTTLVQAHIDSSGATLAAATELVKAQASLAISPLADFTTPVNADTQRAATVARLVQLTTLEQSATLASVVGTVDISGALVTAADLNKAITKAVIGALPAVASAAADPALASLTGPALQTALQAAAEEVVAQAGLTAEEAKVDIGADKLPPDLTPETPTATASLTAFRYTDANNWLVRTLESSAADNTPDAQNNLRYYDVHKESRSSGFSPNGVVHAWGFGNDRTRAGDLHWNGTAWVGCALGQRSTSGVRDAEGRSSYAYCGAFEAGVSKRSAVDIAGQSIATVFSNTIRTFQGGVNGAANGVRYAEWGPANPPQAFGNATFPAGSKLLYQTNTVTASAFAYDVQASAQVSVFPAAIAAGGDGRSADLACEQVTSANSASFLTLATTLEEVVARSPGQPCVFGQGSNADGTSLNPSEWWSNSTVSLGTVANANELPEGTNNYYTTTALLRVGFAATGNGATFYRCLQRRADGSTRNCSVAGTGTYKVETLGDARVLSFTGLPAITQRAGFTRIFVERGGKVYFGYQNPVGVNNNFLRLNMTAADAAFAPLGLPPIRPVTAPGTATGARATTLATLKGAWGGADGDSAFIFRFGDNGRMLFGQADPENLQTREQTGAELGWLDIDPATGAAATLLEVDSTLTAGTSHPQAGDTLTIGANAITTSGGETFGRLQNVANGLVGLWAVDSATDLSATHVAFFSNGRVMLLDSTGDTSGGACTAARQGPPGAELARYEYNAETGLLRVFGKVYDTNGCAGIFDSSQGAVAAGTANTEATFTLTFSANGSVLSGTQNDTGEPLTLHRIATQ